MARSSTKVNLPKGSDTKLQGLTAKAYGSQLPKDRGVPCVGEPLGLSHQGAWRPFSGNGKRVFCRFSIGMIPAPLPEPTVGSPDWRKPTPEVFSLNNSRQQAIFVSSKKVMRAEGETQPGDGYRRARTEDRHKTSKSPRCNSTEAKGHR